MSDVNRPMQADRPRPSNRSWHTESTIIRAGRGSGAPGDPLNVPITPASNFYAAPSDDPATAREYSRDDGTPGWEALESAVGVLEGGRAVAFASGMAAASAVLDSMPVGSVIVASDGSYVGVLATLTDAHQLGRWDVRFVDIADTPAVLDALVGADLLWIETPTNPMLNIADLPALIEAAKAQSAIVAVDNTFATPLRQRPLALGADMVVHSATKFIGGHSDLLCGVVIAHQDAHVAQLRRRREIGGSTPGALEAFLALRGLRTMALRLNQAESNATVLAQRLSALREVTRVRYPGLPTDPGHERAQKQMTGYGAILSFELADADTADSVCNYVELIVSATSVGGVESTIERRAKLPGQEHIPPGLLRLSVGCEHIDDLWLDLTNAIHRASRNGSVDVNRA